MQPIVITRTRAAVALAVGTLVPSVLVVPAVAAQEETAEVYLVQGIPGESVDISVDGETLAEAVATAEVVGPFEVPAGANTVTFTDADGDVVADNTVTTEADSSSDLVVHLASGGSDQAVVTVFGNDLSAVPQDKASLTVAHTAAVPPADILVDDEVLFANVANGESLTLVVPADTYTVQIVPTGESTPLILGPLDVSVEGGSLNRVYAVGDPESDTMNVAQHVLAVEETGSPAPSIVNTGTGGHAVLLLKAHGALSSFTALFR